MKLAAGILACLLSFSACADTQTLSAPVVVPVKDGTMKQVSWFQYEKRAGSIVLYCVRTSYARLTCTVYDYNKGIRLAHDIRATQLGM